MGQVYTPLEIKFIRLLKVGISCPTLCAPQSPPPCVLPWVAGVKMVLRAQSCKKFLLSAEGGTAVTATELARYTAYYNDLCVYSEELSKRPVGEGSNSHSRDFQPAATTPRPRQLAGVVPGTGDTPFVTRTLMTSTAHG